MTNPFSFIEDLRLMNDAMVTRLDEIIKRLDMLLTLERERHDWYGDGR